MKSSFDAKPDGKTDKKRQYYAMLGTRGMWEDGWKAVALHAPLTGKGHFDKDEWQLYHTDVDRSESKDLSKEHPEKLEALKKLWFEEADKNLVLPLDDRTALEILNIERPSSEPPRERYMYYPGTAPVPEGVAVNTRGRSCKIIADVELTDKTSGVIFAHGSRFGGHTLFIKDKKLYYVYNFLGIKPEQFTLSGDGLCIGRDSGDAVSEEYKARVRLRAEISLVSASRWKRLNTSTSRRWQQQHSRETNPKHANKVAFHVPAQ
jgi:hypothetical protein